MSANYKFLERIQPQGYQDKLDDSLLGVYCLTNGSKNCLVSDEGKIVKRKGYSRLGQVGTLTQGVKSAKTWVTSSNTEIPYRGVYDAFQVLYSGSWRNIATGYKTLYKFRSDLWWDKTEGKDRLLFVNGSPTIKSWSGGMTDLFSWTATTVTKKYAKQSSVSNTFTFDAISKTLTQIDTDFVDLGFTVGSKVSITGTTNNETIVTVRTVTASVLTFSIEDTITNEVISSSSCIVGIVGKETWRAERFAQTGTKQINIGGTVFTYTGGENTPTLTGLSADPSAFASLGLFVFQPVIDNTPAGTDLPVGFLIDVIAVNLNQAIFGSTLFRNVYISKQTDFKDVNYTALLRKAGEGGTVYIDSNLVGIATVQEVTYISGGLSDVYTLVFEPFSDGLTAGEILRVQKLATAFGQGAVSHESFVKAKNGMVYLSNEPTIDFLGNIEQITGSNTKPLSDPIKRYLNSINKTDAQGLYYKNYMLFLFPMQGVLMMYDLERGFWQPPQEISGSCMSIYQENVLIHSNTTDESYILFSTFNDNGNPIIMEVRTNVDVIGTRSERKIYDELFVEAYVNNNTKTVYGELLSGFNGAVNIQNFQFGFDEDDKFTETSPSAMGFGGSSFGTAPFGGLPTEDSDAEIGTLKLLRKIFSTSIIESFNQQLRVTNSDIDSYVEIVSWGTNSRASLTSNVDIKE